MTANSKSKLKLLCIMRMLQDETDAKHGLTMRSIIQRLNDQGIQAERKSVYRDMDLLRQFGVPVETYQRNPVEYAIVQREFTLSELELLVDAVQACRFITQRQADSLTSNVKSLAPLSQRSQLARRLHVVGRVKKKNESVLNNVDLIHEALNRKRKIRFSYYKTGIDGSPVQQHDGKPYVLTPVSLVYADGFYYLTCWSDSHESFADYRVDRMADVTVSDESATRNEAIRTYSATDDAYTYFGRFDGPRETVCLRVRPDKADIVMDRFGAEASLSEGDDGYGRATVAVRVSPQFFGWIAGLSGTVSIEGPANVREAYRAYLEQLLEEA